MRPYRAPQPMVGEISGLAVVAESEALETTGVRLREHGSTMPQHRRERFNSSRIQA